MSVDPKHRQIFQSLRDEILTGRYDQQLRLPSEAMLVERFNASRPTVARALRDLQHAGLIERRAGSGSFVRKGGGVESDTRLLGLLIPGLGTTEIFEVICGELASLARGRDYSLLWGGSTPASADKAASVENAEQLCRQYIERRVSGVFFAPFELTPQMEKANRQLVELLRQNGVQVVLLDRDLLFFPNRSDFDLVGIDNVAGGFMLAEHLIKLGCERIRFVVRPLSAPTVDARIAGAREALMRHGLEVPANWVASGNPEDIRFVRSLIAGRQTDAFICANDYTAAVLMRSLESAKVRVPRDVRLVGFDDVKYATLLSVPLTTIHQPCRDIAQIAFRAMLERIAEPAIPARTFMVTPRLVVRESCGAYLPR